VSKQCPKCGLRKLLLAPYWWRDGSRPDGWCVYCADCLREANAARGKMWYARNRTAHIAAVSARRKARREEERAS
jgi:hypothetical protein